VETYSSPRGATTGKRLWSADQAAGFAHPAYGLHDLCMHLDDRLVEDGLVMRDAILNRRIALKRPWMSFLASSTGKKCAVDAFPPQGCYRT
jgi:hypothetical protein